MAFQRGHALVPSVVRVVQLTGAQDLKNLEASGELNLADLLVTASDAIFDRLVADGLDPRVLANAEKIQKRPHHSRVETLDTLLQDSIETRSSHRASKSLVPLPS